MVFGRSGAARGRKGGEAVAQFAQSGATAEGGQLAAIAEHNMRANTAYAHNTKIGQQALRDEHPGFLRGAASFANKMIGLPLMAFTFLAAGAGAVAARPSMQGKAVGTVLGKTHLVGEVLNATPGNVVERTGHLFGQNHIVTKGMGNTAGAMSNMLDKVAKIHPHLDYAVKTVRSNMLMTTGFGLLAAGQGVTGLFKGKYDAGRAAQQMQYDLTGIKMSRSEALKSADVNPLVARARGDYNDGKAKVARGLEVAGVAGNLAITFGMHDGGSTTNMFSKGMMKIMGINMLVGMVPAIGGMILNAKHTTLDGVGQMYKEAAKGKISQAAYEKVIGGLNPNADSQVVSRMSSEAYQTQVPPKELLLKLEALSHSNSFTSRESGRRVAQRNPGQQVFAGATI